MKIDYESHYDEAYWTRQKRFRDGNGLEKVYTGPSIDWVTGWDPIADVLRKLLPIGKLLDIGCGGAGLSGRLRTRGYDSYGVDVSSYAAENCFESMRGRIEVCDITTCPDRPPFGIHKYNTILATDLPEHIYLEDLDKTFVYIKNLLAPGGVAFFLVATVDDGHETFFHKKGEEIPLRWEATAIAGHVSMASYKWWTKKFLEWGFRIRWDLRCMYAQAREMIPWWKTMDAWRVANSYFLDVAT